MDTLTIILLVALGFLVLIGFFRNNFPQMLYLFRTKAYRELEKSYQIITDNLGVSDSELDVMISLDHDELVKCLSEYSDRVKKTKVIEHYSITKDS